MNKTLAFLAPLILASCARPTGPQAEAGAPPAEVAPARYEQVPVELMRYAAANGSAYDTLPPGFPNLALPDSLSVLGSMDWSTRQRVVFAAANGVEEGVREARQALEAEGWLVLPLRPPERRDVFAPSETDFTAQASASAFPGGRAQTALLCHDTLGVLTLGAVEDRGAITLDLDRRSMRGGPPCASRFRQAEEAIRFPLERYLPLLRLPEGGSEARGGGGGSDERQASVRLTSTPLSLRRLTAHFADQMTEQGWRRDAEWRGRTGAGSTWTRPTDDGRLALGMLDIRPLDDGYDIDFRLRLICDPEADEPSAACTAEGVDAGIRSPSIGIRGIPLRID